MKKYIYISLFTFTMVLTACSSLDESGIADAIAVDGQNIRMHATIKVVPVSMFLLTIKQIG
jgi:hypothetical protein